MFKKWMKRYKARGVKSLKARFVASDTCAALVAESQCQFARELDLVTIYRRYREDQVMVRKIIRQRCCSY